MQHQPTEQSNVAQPSVRDESREVARPADELGVGETHELETAHEARESARPGMDIDLVEENTDVDLKQPMATLMRDEKLEIEETNRETMALLNRLGSDTAKYRSERSKSTEGDSRPQVSSRTQDYYMLCVGPDNSGH